MRQKIVKRLIVTAILVGIAAVVFAVKRVPLGIDLAGGAEMLYRLDDEELKAEIALYRGYLSDLGNPGEAKRLQEQPSGDVLSIDHVIW